MRCIQGMAFSVRMLTLLRCLKKLGLLSWDQSQTQCVCSAASMMQRHLHRMLKSQSWQVHLIQQLFMMAHELHICIVLLARKQHCSSSSRATLALHRILTRTGTLCLTFWAPKASRCLHQGIGAQNGIVHVETCSSVSLKPKCPVKLKGPAQQAHSMQWHADATCYASSDKAYAEI